MSVINVRTLFKISLEEIRNLKTNLNIKFEDGVTLKDLNYKHVIVFRFLLDFVNEIDMIEITSDLWIDNYLENGYFNKSTYTKLYSTILRRYVEKHIKPTYNIALLKPLLQGMYRSINNIPRYLNEVIGKYVIGVDIQDIIYVQFQEELLEAIKTVHEHPSQANILKTYDVLDTIVRNKLDKENIIRLIYLSGMVSINQIKQLFGSRGYLTELDNSIFKYPMANSFTLGAKNIYELTIESRAGAKALYLSTKAIQDSEYMARELQLAGMYVERIEWTDCGQKDYKEFLITEKNFRNFLGKRYFDEDTQSESTITPEVKSKLINKEVKVRISTRCKLRDKKKVCAACIGDLAFSILPHFNLGHVTITTITRDITQSILSTKHLTGSASSGEVILRPDVEKYFTLRNKNKLYINKQLADRKTVELYLHIPQSEVPSFYNALKKKLQDINLNQGSVENIVLEIKDKRNNEHKFETLNMKVGSRKPLLTINMWNYLIKNRDKVTLNEYDHYVVPLDDWDPKDPMFKYEEKEFDFASLSKQFKSLLERRKFLKDRKTGRYIPEYTPEVLLEKLFELVNTKLNVNIAKLEILVYAFIAQDFNNRDYDLGRNSKYRDLIGLKYAIAGRSLGSALNWDENAKKVYYPHSYIPDKKPDHPLDVLLTPNEVIEHLGED